MTSENPFLTKITAIDRSQDDFSYAPLRLKDRQNSVTWISEAAGQGASGAVYRLVVDRTGYRFIGVSPDRRRIREPVDASSSTAHARHTAEIREICRLHASGRADMLDAASRQLASFLLRRQPTTTPNWLPADLPPLGRICRNAGEYPSPDSFLGMCRSGHLTVEDISQWMELDREEDQQPSGKPLDESLGLTPDEYERWITGQVSLNDILVEIVALDQTS